MSQSMPEYFEFNDGVYADGETTIKPDADVRMKLQGVKYEQSGIVSAQKYSGIMPRCSWHELV